MWYEITRDWQFPVEIGASCGYDFYYPQSNGFMGVKYQGYLWPFTFSKI